MAASVLRDEDAGTDALMLATPDLQHLPQKGEALQQGEADRHRFAAAVWAVHGAVSVCMIVMTVCYQPLANLMNDYLSCSGDDWILNEERKRLSDS